MADFFWGKLADGSGWVRLTWYGDLWAKEIDGPAGAEAGAGAVYNPRTGPGYYLATKSIGIFEQPALVPGTQWKHGVVLGGTEFSVSETKTDDVGGFFWGKLTDGSGWVRLTWYGDLWAKEIDGPAAAEAGTGAGAGAVYNPRTGPGYYRATKNFGVFAEPMVVPGTKWSHRIIPGGTEFAVTETKTDEVGGFFWGKLADGVPGGSGWVRLTWYGDLWAKEIDGP